MVHLLPSSIFMTRWIDIRKWLGEWIWGWMDRYLEGGCVEWTGEKLSSRLASWTLSR